MSSHSDDSRASESHSRSSSTPAVNPSPPSRGRWSWLSFLVGVVGTSTVFVVLGGGNRPAAVVPDQASVEDASNNQIDVIAKANEIPSSMDEVLRIAEEALSNMRQSLDDYTATLFKQETVGGVLSEPTKMDLKVMCVHRGGKVDDSEPMRVYLRFLAPSSVAGREVIWAKDLHEGKLIVHEGGLMGLMTVRLDPTGMIAMRGQRYPIYEIGLTKLVQKLIERGEPDRDNPEVKVTIKRGIVLDGVDCDLITVSRMRPSGKPNDFSRAEICFDTSRKLPIRYSAYGWPENTQQAPLIESYTYQNIRTNVGLSETDFDPKNPEYNYP